MIGVSTLLIITVMIYMQHPKFGKSPAGTRLKLISQSPNFKDGKFQNLNPTVEIVEGHSVVGVSWNFLFNKDVRSIPADSLPSVKTDLHQLPKDTDVLVWFGHSSYFIQLDGKRILVDPVFSGNASPVPRTNRSFKGADIYAVADLPSIDYLFISHDHYDHLDYQTILALKDKVGRVICGLGVGAHFEHWGYPAEKITELDWNENADLDSGCVAYATPARHFSGRAFSKNNTLWTSFVYQSRTMRIFFGGDSGYGTHFAEIGEKYGPVDLAILENGQYNVAWGEIHTLPYQVLKAGQDLKAKRLFPVHSSKFVLANHAWDEPLVQLSGLNAGSQHPLPLVTPMIGETVFLKDEKQVFQEWWVGVK